MKKPAIIPLGILVLTAGFLAGSWYQKLGEVSNKDRSGRAILYYVDPMHPSYKSDKPGIAPDCGMKLEPVYTGSGTESGMANDPVNLPPGTVRINTDRQQLIGVEVGTVEKKPASQTIRVTGRVSVDETREYRINATSDGWIQDVFPVTVGSFVTKNQPLASFYSPEFLSAEQAYFYALNALDRFAQQDPPNEAQIKISKVNIQQNRDTLKNLGMGDPQLDELAKTREYTKKIIIPAPVTGFVVVRNVTPGERYERGKELYRFADISHVWVLADVFENEAQYLKPGVTARVAVPNLNRTFYAKVSDVLPQFDPASRTMKVRLEADNPGFMLRPDMFVDVELPIRLPPAVSVPADAIIDSGLKKTVFVDLGNGYFEPRKVETGWRFGDRVEIVKGLAPGERIAISGNFLIDSESRMKAPAAQIAPATAADPACGHVVDTGKARRAGLISTYHEKTYYFWSSECKQQFDKDP
ncbi:MAG TPA: efflux RND transporter periplasmic adaptor subunit, partial [Nitrospirota bacterium]